LVIIIDHRHSNIDKNLLVKTQAYIVNFISFPHKLLNFAADLPVIMQKNSFLSDHERIPKLIAVQYVEALQKLGAPVDTPKLHSFTAFVCPTSPIIYL